MNDFSELLFARPSLIGGLSRVLDLGATLTEYNRSKSEAEADARAIASDWKAVGVDIERAITEQE